MAWVGNPLHPPLSNREEPPFPPVKEDNVLDNPLPSGLLLVAVVWVWSAASGFHPCV